MRLIACFTQMGGLRGMLPLLENLARKMEVIWYGREVVCHYLNNCGITASHFRELKLRAECCDILLTDTINLSRIQDGLFYRQIWQDAASFGIPSIAFVDCWWGYLERFTVPGEKLVETLLPDSIAVVDEIAFNDMVSLGFPKSRLHILGSPWLSELACSRSNLKIARAAARMQYGFDRHERVLVFVSQPLAQVLNDRESWGFTEQDVIPALVRACAALPENIRAHFRLILLAHPEENEAVLAGLLGDLFPPFFSKVCKESDPLNLLIACDAVAGMFSILLVEALLCGLPVVSIQPGLRREDMLVTNRIGSTLAVRAVTNLPEVIGKLLCDEAYRTDRLRRQASFPVVSEAQNRWSQFLLHLLSDRKIK